MRRLAYPLHRMLLTIRQQFRQPVSRLRHALPISAAIVGLLRLSGIVGTHLDWLTLPHHSQRIAGDGERKAIAVRCQIVFAGQHQPA